MLVKRIVCTVEAHQRGSFHMAQMEWAALRTVEGFIAQLGGWDTSDASIAYIYSFWENRDYYEDFMENIHDEIFSHSNQIASYTSIKVVLFQGMASRTAINDWLRNCSFIETNVIDCGEVNERFGGTLLFFDSTGRTLLLTDRKIGGTSQGTVSDTKETFKVTEAWGVY
ncbi:YdbC family protein [Rossellomorea marisflavi]|uniref:YdbC family protein n=1 Tax=Rossellomorea marisflavi TaxID=189381 RepID=UPI0028535E2B|nr:YdbC family protein [Rossellomorea marisflavi]MDR4938270.1 YdbC family protein [Rossellomorea marisflavi]